MFDFDLGRLKMPDDSQADKFTIFLSHKAKDSDVARRLKELLDRHSDGNVRIFISEEIGKGEKWRQAISKTLSDSRALILLFADPNEDWGWCLYETGYFDGLSSVKQQFSTNAIYCLNYETDPPPDPIADLQTVKINVNDISQWLKKLYEQIEESTKVSIKQQRLADVDTVSKEIVRVFQNRRERLYRPKSLFIYVEYPDSITMTTLPDNAILSGASDLINEIFAVQKEKLNRSEVKQILTENSGTANANKILLREIARALYLALRHRLQPIQGVVFVGETPKRYNPVILSAHKLQNGGLECEILFVQDVGGQVQNMRADLNSLLTGIRMAVRIRYEVVEPYVGNIAKLNRLFGARLKKDLQIALNNVFTEAEFRTLYDPKDLIEAFEEEDEVKIIEMTETFPSVNRNIWKLLGVDDVEQSFGPVSDGALDGEAVQNLEEALDSLNRMNHDFLVISTRRAEVLIRTDLRENSRTSS